MEGTRAYADDNPATGATWGRYDTTNSWQTAGGFGANDCEQSDIGNTSWGANESAGSKDISLTPTTKNGLDYGLEQGGNATGWLIKATTESDDMYQISSSDNAAAANRPKLTVEYEAGGGGKDRLKLMPLKRSRMTL